MPRVRTWAIVIVAGAAASGCGRLGYQAHGIADGGGADAGEIRPIAEVFDDFEDGIVSTIWFTYQHPAPESHHSETGGALLIALAQSVDSSYAGYVTRASYDLRGGSIAADVLEVSPTTGAQCYLTCVDATDTLSLEMGTDGANLSFAQNGVVISVVPYDPRAQRYWRIRESAGTVFFETSGDASTWDTPETTSTAAWASAARVNIGGGTNVPIVSAGQCRFGSVGG